jgi:hypothetical protein
MDVYDQTNYIVVCRGNFYALIFTLVKHVLPLWLQWPFRAAWTGSMGQCSVYLS